PADQENSATPHQILAIRRDASAGIEQTGGWSHPAQGTQVTFRRLHWRPVSYVSWFSRSRSARNSATTFVYSACSASTATRFGEDHSMSERRACSSWTISSRGWKDAPNHTR